MNWRSAEWNHEQVNYLVSILWGNATVHLDPWVHTLNHTTNHHIVSSDCSTHNCERNVRASVSYRQISALHLPSQRTTSWGRRSSLLGFRWSSVHQIQGWQTWSRSNPHLLIRVPIYQNQKNNESELWSQWIDQKRLLYCDKVVIGVAYNLERIQFETEMFQGSAPLRP